MNSFKKIILVAYLTCLPTVLFPWAMNNPYKKEACLFAAENNVTGKYWAGNKKYPGKADIGEDKFIKVIAIKKNNINKKYYKKLRKNKMYLGVYTNPTTEQEYNLYGEKKNADKIDDAPDAAVLTEIAIKEDYGPGE
jgi:hypothetical protein